MAIRKYDNKTEYADTCNELGAFQGNCYGFISAGINNNSNMLRFLKRIEINDIFDGMKQSEQIEVLTESVRKKLEKLIVNGQDRKAYNFFCDHYQDIYHYREKIKSYFKGNGLRCVIVEFLDDKGASIHAAFVDKYLKIYDKDSKGKFNLGYDIDELFKCWRHRGARYFKCYALDEDQSNNVEKYINSLISIKLNNPKQILL